MATSANHVKMFAMIIIHILQYFVFQKNSTFCHRTLVREYLSIQGVLGRWKSFFPLPYWAPDLYTMWLLPVIIVDKMMLKNVWDELDYLVDVCHITQQQYIRTLWVWVFGYQSHSCRILWKENIAFWNWLSHIDIYNHIRSLPRLVDDPVHSKDIIYAYSSVKSMKYSHL